MARVKYFDPRDGVWKYADSQFVTGSGNSGAAGKDGKTPVKGVDYYTDTDKNEMVDLVLAALPTWTGGSY